MAYRRVRTKYCSYTTRLQYYRYSKKTCNYQEYKCPKLCIDGFNYCSRHILKDDNAPFRQCSYTYIYTSKRCPNAAPKNENIESFCPDHAFKMLKSRDRAGKSQPPLNAERLMSSLEHLVKPNETKLSDSGPSSSVHSLPLNPFININSSDVNESVRKVLDYCSESDSDVEATTIDRTTNCKDEDSSDPESVDSSNEDPFKSTTVLTVEEILKRSIDKSERLKTLYVDQLKHISHTLKENRRDYILSLQKEKEAVGPIGEQVTGSIKDVTLAEKIRSFNQYHKTFGIAAVLRKKRKDKKKGLAFDGHARPGVIKCIFTEGGVKCSVRTVPNAKYCPKHILSDNSQVLFRPCGFTAEGHTCQEPLRGIDPCFYHMEMVPPHISYNTALSSEDEENIKDEKPLPSTANFPLPNHQDRIGNVKVESGVLNMIQMVDAETFGFEEEIEVCDASSNPTVDNLETKAILNETVPNTENPT